MKCTLDKILKYTIKTVRQNESLSLYIIRHMPIFHSHPLNICSWTRLEKGTRLEGPNIAFLIYFGERPFTSFLSPELHATMFQCSLLSI